MRPKHILVTGNRGPVGSNLVKELSINKEGTPDERAYPIDSSLFIEQTDRRLPQAYLQTEHQGWPSRSSNGGTR